MRGVENIPWMYDALCTVLEWGGMKRWRGWLARGARGRVLEVGCGTGRNLERYESPALLVAVEPRAATLARARTRGDGVLFVRASAEALPFRDDAFDTVVSSLVFCSVPRPAVGLEEISRVMAEGAELRMMEHVRSESPTWGKVQDAMQPAWTWVAGGCHPNRDTEAAVEAAGFTIEAEGRRKNGNMRRFVARRTAQAR
jgi:ubiquinone/menaquinone biosynthesis C-methylase UbiE